MTESKITSAMMFGTEGLTEKVDQLEKELAELKEWKEKMHVHFQPPTEEERKRGANVTFTPGEGETGGNIIFCLNKGLPPDKQGGFFFVDEHDNVAKLDFETMTIRKLRPGERGPRL